MNTYAITYKRFWEPSYLQNTTFSLIAGTIASAITYPMEFLKTIIQFQSTAIGFRDRKSNYQGYNPFKILRDVHGTGAGLSALYTGFDAHLVGRLTYLTVRNTVYLAIYNNAKPIKPTNDLSYRQKAWIGALAGAIGAFASNPFTVISIRQILDGQIRKEWRRNYCDSSILTAYKQISQIAGEAFTGLKVNIIRHVLLNVSMTGPYDYFNQGFYTRFGDYGWVSPLALALSSFVGAAVTLPFDNIRTKIIQMHKEPERNRLNFNGIFQGIKKSLHVETHPFSLWAGFYTYYPCIFLYAFLTLEITNKFIQSYKKKEGLLDWQI